MSTFIYVPNTILSLMYFKTTSVIGTASTQGKMDLICPNVYAYSHRTRQYLITAVVGEYLHSLNHKIKIGVPATQYPVDLVPLHYPSLQHLILLGTCLHLRAGEPQA